MEDFYVLDQGFIATEDTIMLKTQWFFPFQFAQTFSKSEKLQNTVSNPCLDSLVPF